MRKIIKLIVGSMLTAAGGSVCAQPQWALDTTLSTGQLSQGIAITPDNTKIIVTDNVTPSAIQIISTADYSMVTVTYTADGFPNAVAVTPDGSAALVNTTHQTLYINLATDSVSDFFAAPCVATTLYGLAVYGASAVYPDLSSGCTEQGLRFINAELPNSASTFVPIATKGELTGIGILGNTALVTAWNAAPVLVNLATSDTQTIGGMTESYGVAMLHHSNEALVFDGDSVDRVSLATGSISKKIAPLSSNTGFQNLAITKDDKYAFAIGSFEERIIALANDSVLQTFPIGGVSVAADSDGSAFYVTDSYGGQVRVYKAVGNSSLSGLKKIPSGIFVFPSVTSGIITIRGSGENAAVNIYNMLGVTIYHADFLALRQESVDLSARPKGIYAVKVRAGNQVGMQKILIQ